MNTTHCSSKCSLLEKPLEGYKRQEGCAQTLQTLQLGDMHWAVPDPVPQAGSLMPITAACSKQLHGAAEAGEMEAIYSWEYQGKSQDTRDLQRSLGISQIQLGNSKIKFSILHSFLVMGSRTAGCLGVSSIHTE